jgi:arabinogalactan endo-1,4-beta-galactosidase
MARRVEAAGLRLLLAFHYSDTWADPDDQNKPLAWEGCRSTSSCSRSRGIHATDPRAFAAAGVTPDLVQLGNGITPGFLFPDGSISAPGNFPRFAALLRAAIEAAREAIPECR